MSEKQRFLADPTLRLTDFAYLFLVRCPRCQRCARVIPEPDATRDIVSPYFVKRVRLLCSYCGAIKEMDKCTRMRVGGPCDWYFYLPLYLQIPCCGHVLWALNLEHLRYLAEYIQADIREGSTTRSAHVTTTYGINMIARLPKWIKSAKNRNEIIKCIHKLRDSTTS